MIEIASTMFDFALSACDRYPPPSARTGICTSFWSGVYLRGGKCTVLGWIIWLSYPFFMTAGLFQTAKYFSRYFNVLKPFFPFLLWFGVMLRC